MVVLCIYSCTSENNIFDNNSNKLLNFSVSVPEWKNNDSTSYNTRATPISGTSLDRSSSFNIIADVYDGKSSYSTIIKDESVSFTNNMWQTTASHYWSGTANNTLNFYAYYPTTISSSITHTAGAAPSLSYTVPNDAVNQIDIMTATASNVSGSTNSSTPLTFSHIFAAVQFSVGSAGMPDGTITGITLNNILYKGTYNLNGTWTQDPTSKKSFSQTVSASTNAGTAITSGVMTFMMMPQTLGSDANITVTYSNGGTLTKSISGTWDAGKIYTYNISKTIPVANFDYTGNVQTYTVPLTGTYKLEVWGAQGGSTSISASYIGGLGGYSYGNSFFSKDQNLYIYVGGAGVGATDMYQSLTGGYNGGGNVTGDNSVNHYTSSGGGATHIATVPGLLSTLSSNTSAVFIVAGGGGGARDQINLEPASRHGNGGSGGGLSGGGDCEGTQTTGYAFGLGQSGIGNSAGGAGWYGGYSGSGGSVYVGYGSGGSGYIGGVSNGGTSNGVRTGNGYARITFISAN